MSVHLTKFEELRLTSNDTMWIRDEGGSIIYGIYLGEYDRNNGTFKFLNNSTGNNETVYLNKIQHIGK